jgi:TonB-linked SusC/RagA family outer membrane protein
MRHPKRLLQKGICLVSLCVTIMLLGCFTANAQTKTVNGKIVNAGNNEPIAGATVKVKGGEAATSTDNDGNFNLTVPEKATLEISAIGYSTVRVKASFTGPMGIRMEISNTQMADVVVIGYGTTKKATLTGSVATVNAKTFQDRGPIANPLAALQGQVPGVAVTRSSAQPGRESWNFLIRGNSSLNQTEPLVIIDGSPMPALSALNSFNPADIDNISFLKDGAAAIYGARAAGGVVLITTKRARNGKSVIEYNGSVSKKSIGLMPKLVDITGWGPMIKEARTNDGFPAADIWNNYADMAIWAVNNNVNYLSKADATAKGFGLLFSDVKDFVFFPGTMQDVMWDDATSTEHQLSISSRNDKSGYRISMGYLNDGSLLQYGTNSNNRYNLRLAHDYQFSKNLKLESNISLEKNDIVQPANMGSVLNNGIQPGLPLTNAYGKPYLWGSGIGNATPNNIADYGGENKEYNTRLNTNFTATYSFTNELKAVATAAYYFHHTDYRTNESLIPFYEYMGTTPYVYLSPSNATRSFYQRTSRKESYYNVNAYLEWNKTISADHDVRVMAGSQYERDEMNRFMGRTMDVLAAVPPSLSLGTGDAASKSTAEAQNHYAIAGYFGRANYTFRNKYLFEVNFRYDGSSKFDADNRWKAFYGVLGAWRISQEKFMQTVSFIDELKLRASWGTAGNQSGIDYYDYIQLMNLNYSQGANQSNYPILGTSPVVRVSPAGMVALDRTWERVTTKNLGLDFAVLKSRLSGSFEYFLKNNNNMLLGRALPAVLGATAPFGNNGEMETKGWEFALSWRGKAGEVNYHIGGNISDFKNKLINYGGYKVIGTGFRGYHGQGAPNSANYPVEGYPINGYFGLVYAGRIQTQKELDDYRQLLTGNNIGMPSGGPTAQANARLALGDNMFKDVNGDGKLTIEGDAVYLGTDDPRMSYSFNGGLDWKGIDLNFIFQGVGKRAIMRDGNWRIPAQVIFQAQNAAYLNKWWTPDRTDAELPRISTTGTINNYNYQPSNWVMENGAYLRLKNLVIGYTLPVSITQKAHIQRLRFYFSGNDLWEITHIRDGWDPEATRGVGNGGDNQNNNVSTFSQRYPFYRFYTVGINVTF